MSKYTGTLDTPKVGLRRYIKKGDKNKYVGQWQAFLNWYIGKNVCVIDNIYGDITYKYTIQFQTETFSAKEADGKVGAKTIKKAKAYDKTSGKKKYTGKFPEIHVKRTAQEVANGAAEWAQMIATINNFHYGEGGNSKKDFGKDVYNITHSSGCYFCGTNATTKVAKIKKLKRSDLIADHWYKTYVCNPFVYSSWVHGGLVTNMACKKNGNLSIFTNSSTFKNLGHPSFNTLKKGDVMLKYDSNGNFKHAAIYVGNGNYSEATSYTGKFGNAASKSSIRTKTLTSSHYKDFQKVCRFNKSVDADVIIKHGEYSSRVGDWQDFLNWWSDGQFYKDCGGRDNMFGDNTKTWTIKFQEQEIGRGTGDGLVGNKTINKAKEIEK